jgi:hypothetical protein
MPEHSLPQRSFLAYSLSESLMHPQSTLKTVRSCALVVRAQLYLLQLTMHNLWYRFDQMPQCYNMRRLLICHRSQGVHRDLGKEAVPQSREGLQSQVVRQQEGSQL